MPKARQKRDYQLHISLLDIEPMIWRRILVPDHLSFKKLHEAIQIAMGWEDYHLYEFRFGPLRFGIPDGEFFVPDQQTVFDAARKKLTSVDFLPDDLMTYTYDFGDNWVHAIRVEAVWAKDENRKGIVCLDGARACPPEDIGGRGTYQQLIRLKDDPSARKKQVEEWNWLSGLVDLDAFQPDLFDLQEVNEKLFSLTK